MSGPRDNGTVPHDQAFNTARSGGRPMYNNWDDYIAARATRKFPNPYEKNPENFLPDLAQALGHNRPDSR
jgi:hypothetical protein